MDLASIAFYSLCYSIGFTAAIVIVWAWRKPWHVGPVRIDEEQARLDRIARSDFRIVGNPELERQIRQHMGKKGFRAGQSRNFQ